MVGECNVIDTNLDLRQNLKEAKVYEDEARREAREERKFWDDRAEAQAKVLDITEYDRFIECTDSVAEAMGQSILAGQRRIEMAELIQQIEKSSGPQNYLKIQLAELLVGGTTDELKRMASE